MRETKMERESYDPTAKGTRPELRANDTLAPSVLSTFTVNPRARTSKHFCTFLSFVTRPVSVVSVAPPTSEGEYGVLLSYRSADGAYTQPKRRFALRCIFPWPEVVALLPQHGARSAALLSLLFFPSSVFTLPSPTVRMAFSAG